jgi:trans-aconitate methyltransferase
MDVSQASTGLPKLYTELADWWQVLSVPEDYAEEVQFYLRAILSACTFDPETMLELGCGGGNNASHLKNRFQMTLVDLSPEMLQVSERLNPECEHIQGDMRSVRLGRKFDTVFIHDAIAYMLTEDDLRKAIKTAYVHCKAGAVALFTPDHIRETFRESTDHGGHDRGGRSLRYLDWTWDPDPEDTTYISQMVYVLRDQMNEVRCVQDKHTCGLFSHQTWMDIISHVGFKAQSLPFEHSEIEPGTTEVFLGIKPEDRSK